MKTHNQEVTPVLEAGSQPKSDPPLHFEPIPGEDEFFQILSQAIEENRQRENEAQVA